MASIHRSFRCLRQPALEYGVTMNQPGNAPSGKEPPSPAAAPKQDDDSNQDGTAARSPVLKWAVFVVVAVVAAVLYRKLGHLLTLETIAEREADLRGWYRDSPWLLAGAAFGVYVAVTGLSLPGAAVLTLACGWFFGFWQALLLVSFASTTGAFVAFLLSRFLLQDAIQQRFQDRLATFNEALERDGAFYLFTLRLIPAVPFFVINLVMGLTPLRAWTFWWVSQLGMLPGTCVYTWAGSTIPSAGELAEAGVGQILSLELVIAFVVLGVFPLVVRRVLTRLRPAAAGTAESAGTADD